MSCMASCSNISTTISSGILDIGHGGAGLRSVGASSPRIEVLAYSLIRLWYVGERPCREWWAVLGTVAEALDGLGSWGLGTGWDDAGVDDETEALAACAALSFLKYEGGKCFALYVS